MALLLLLLYGTGYKMLPMGIKPMESPRWHVAWCFSKASMVHSWHQCRCHIKNMGMEQHPGHTPGGRAVTIRIHDGISRMNLDTSEKLCNIGNFGCMAWLAHKRCQGCNLLGSGLPFLDQMGHSWKYIGLFQIGDLMGQNLLQEIGLKTLGFRIGYTHHLCTWSTLGPCCRGWPSGLL